jgi:hypothetical protein
MSSAESEARKALNRLSRALEKSRRELRALQGAIRMAEGEDFPSEAYRTAEERLESIEAFLQEEARRLQGKILQAGGIEPGRVRRGSP